MAIVFPALFFSAIISNLKNLLIGVEQLFAQIIYFNRKNVNTYHYGILLRDICQVSRVVFLLLIQNSTIPPHWKKFVPLFI